MPRTRPAWPAQATTLALGTLAAVLTTAIVVRTSLGSEAALPQYQRKAAAEEACKAVAVEVSSLRLMSPIRFVDDCSAPRTTAVVDQPGHLIVTRVAEGRAGRNDGRRKVYSVLMDGRRTDAWHMLQVNSAPSAGEP